MPTIALNRSRAGWYRASNGLDVLDPNYVSITVIREREGGWSTRYFTSAGGHPIRVWDEKLSDARIGIAAIFGSERPVPAWLIQSRHVQAVNDAIEARIDQLMAELAS